MAVETIIEIDDIFMDIDRAMPCGMLVNETITNSFKYAFPKFDKGIIGVSIKKDASNINLNIWDNGVGLPGNVDFEKNSRLGMQLIFLLTKQLNGTVTIDREKGTAYSINFTYNTE